MVKHRLPKNVKKIAVEYYKNNNLSFEKVAEIEQGYDKDSISDKEVSEPPAADTQWTDEQGHTWLRRPDGSTFWWNGSNWQKV